MGRIKLVYIISDIDKALAFEWIATFLDKEKFDLSFVLLNSGHSHLEHFLRSNRLSCLTIKCRGKKDWIRSWWKLYRHLRDINPDVVHCHLLQANIIGLSAAKAAGISQRIYTRHHSALHHVYHRKGIIWDKIANSQATDIIAISGMVRKVLRDWEQAAASKIHTIPHGFLLDFFEHVEKERITKIREKYNVPAGATVIGVVSRFTEWKGVQYIIPAFKKLLELDGEAVLMLYNATGDYAEVILELLQSLPQGNYRVITFESDISAAFHAMDAFIHVPVDEYQEAFGQIYIEALASGTPSVFTLSGIAPDFIKDEYNALVVPFRDSEAIFHALKKLLYTYSVKEQLRLNGPKSVRRQFDLKIMIDKLSALYEKRN
jgi:glycosyltransferase involved in cell wall biosynthesis